MQGHTPFYGTNLFFPLKSAIKSIKQSKILFTNFFLFSNKNTYAAINLGNEFRDTVQNEKIKKQNSLGVYDIRAIFIYFCFLFFPRWFRE